MRYEIEGIIPQRQYENIYVKYICETQAEKESAIIQILNDLRKYNGVISKETPLPFYRPKEGEVVESGGIIYTYQDGAWSFKTKI